MPLILRYGEEADGFLIFLLIYEERFVPFHPIFICIHKTMESIYCFVKYSMEMSYRRIRVWSLYFNEIFHNHNSNVLFELP